MSEEQTLSDEKIARYVVETMLPKQRISEVFRKFGLPFRESYSYEKLGSILEQKPNLVSKEWLRLYTRSKWQNSSKNLHLENLKSGKLKGHSWHETVPSMLHLSLQQKVRSHISGLISFDELLQIGTDIVKHEYFILATHDLLEIEIIQQIDNVIPTLRPRSFSDFILNGIPYDLKCTEMSAIPIERRNNEKAIAEGLFRGGSAGRNRNCATGVFSNWGLNKFYVVVKNSNEWLSSPEEILKRVVETTQTAPPPHLIRINKDKFYAQVVVV